MLRIMNPCRRVGNLQKKKSFLALFTLVEEAEGVNRTEIQLWTRAPSTWDGLKAKKL